MIDKLLLEAIEVLSNEKTRPNFENIAKFMSRNYSTTEAETFAELNYLLRQELIVEVSFKNVQSYRVASKWNRAHLGCQREQRAKIKRLIYQAIRAVVNGKSVGRTVLNPSDLESSPERVSDEEVRRRSRRGSATRPEMTQTDRDLFGASLDEIYGFVSMKDTEGITSMIKLKRVLEREIYAGKLKLLEDGSYRLAKLKRMYRRRIPKSTTVRNSATCAAPEETVKVECPSQSELSFPVRESPIEDSSTSLSPWRLALDPTSDKDIARGASSVDWDATSPSRMWSRDEVAHDCTDQKIKFASRFRNLDNDHQEIRGRPLSQSPLIKIPSLSSTPPTSRLEINSKGLDASFATIESLSEIDRSMEGRDVLCWAVEDVAVYFSKQGLPSSCIDAFTRELIDGRALVLLSRDDVLARFGLKVGVALKTHRLIQALQRDNRPG